MCSIFKGRFILEIYGPLRFVQHPPTYLRRAEPFEDSFTCLRALKGAKTCEFTALISEDTRKCAALFGRSTSTCTAIEQNFYNKMPSTIAPHSDRLLLWLGKLSGLTRKALEFATVNDDEALPPSQQKLFCVKLCFFLALSCSNRYRQ